MPDFFSSQNIGLEFEENDFDLMFPNEKSFHFVYIYKKVLLKKDKTINIIEDNDQVNVCYKPTVELFKHTKYKFYAINKTPHNLKDQDTPIYTENTFYKKETPTALKYNKLKEIKTDLELKWTLNETDFLPEFDTYSEKHNLFEQNEFIELYSYFTLKIKKEPRQNQIIKVIRDNPNVYLTNIFPTKTPDRYVGIENDQEELRVVDEEMPLVKQVNQILPKKPLRPFREQLTPADDDETVVSSKPPKAQSLNESDPVILLLKNKLISKSDKNKIDTELLDKIQRKDLDYFDDILHIIHYLIVSDKLRYILNENKDKDADSFKPILKDFYLKHIKDTFIEISSNTTELKVDANIKPRIERIIQNFTDDIITNTINDKINNIMDNEGDKEMLYNFLDILYITLKPDYILDLYKELTKRIKHIKNITDDLLKKAFIDELNEINRYFYEESDFSFSDNETLKNRIIKAQNIAIKNT